MLCTVALQISVEVVYMLKHWAWIETFCCDSNTYPTVFIFSIQEENCCSSLSFELSLFLQELFLHHLKKLQACSSWLHFCAHLQLSPGSKSPETTGIISTGFTASYLAPSTLQSWFSFLIGPVLSGVAYAENLAEWHRSDLLPCHSDCRYATYRDKAEKEQWSATGWSRFLWNDNLYLALTFNIKVMCNETRRESALMDSHPLPAVSISCAAGTGPGTDSQRGSVCCAAELAEMQNHVSINFCWSAALKMERNNQNKLSLAFKARYSFSGLQQKWLWEYYIFITIFVQRRLICPSQIASSGHFLNEGQGFHLHWD